MNRAFTFAVSVVSFADAAVDVFPPTATLAVARGCLVTACKNTSGFAAAEAAAQNADLAVLQVRLAAEHANLLGNLVVVSAIDPP